MILTYGFTCSAPCAPRGPRPPWSCLGFVEPRNGVLLSIPLTLRSERGQWDISGQQEAFPQSWTCSAPQVLPEQGPMELGSPLCQRPVDPLLPGWDSLLGAAFTRLLIAPVIDTCNTGAWQQFSGGEWLNAFSVIKWLF